MPAIAFIICGLKVKLLGVVQKSAQSVYSTYSTYIYRYTSIYIRHILHVLYTLYRFYMFYIGLQSSVEVPAAPPLRFCVVGGAAGVLVMEACADLEDLAS